MHTHFLRKLTSHCVSHGSDGSAGRSIGRFQGIPSVEDDILPNLRFAMHPIHTQQEAEHYECVLDGLKNALCTYLITTGHPHGNWNGAVAYPPGVRSLEWTSLRYEMLYAAAFPHMNPGQESKIKVRVFVVLRCSH